MLTARLLHKFAIPAMLMDSEDFALSNETHNLTMSKLFQYSRKQDLPQLNPSPQTHDLFMGGDWNDTGFIVLIHKQTGLIGYFVRFDVTDHGVIQTSLWNSAIDLTTKGLPAKVFWFLFERYGAIMSDAIHSQLGRGFWLRRMQEAEQKSLSIGLLDESTNTILWKEDAPLQGWLTEHNAWGADLYHLRFIIRK